MSVFDGLSRPLRAAGLALIGVAVIAGVIGGVTLAIGNGEEPEQTASPTGDAQPTSAPRTTSPQTTASSPASPTGTGRQSTPATTRPGQGGTPSAVPGEPRQPRPGDGNGNGDGDGDGGQDRPVIAQRVEVRVYNNSKISGLAEQASEAMRDEGWHVVQTGNYSQGTIPATTAYYRPGTDEEKAAKVLANQFGMRAQPRFEGIEESSPGVIVIVTKDWNAAGTSK